MNSVADTSQVSRDRSGWAISLIALAMLLRLGLAYISWGSSDATVWESYGRLASEVGVRHLYVTEARFNHPPLMGYFGEFVYRISRHDDPSARRLGMSFPFVFKLFDIAADAISCWILYAMFRPNLGAAMFFAFSPLSILITAHQCNTDPIYAMLCLLSVYLIDRRGRDFSGGLALAAAINVKLIPVLLVPVLIALYRDRARLVRFLAGLSIGAIPFIAIILVEPSVFHRNVLAYASAIDHWGVNEFLLETAREPRFSAVTQTIMDQYYVGGRYLILASVLLLALRARRQLMLATKATACAASLFLILTPGFGVQYLIFPLPLLLASRRPLQANLYSLCAGLMLLFIYWQQWQGGLPIDSYALVGPRAPGPLFGLLAWATLIVFVFTELRKSCYDRPA